jgi:hypothetical protein
VRFFPPCGIPRGLAFRLFFPMCQGICPRRLSCLLMELA